MTYGDFHLTLSGVTVSGESQPPCYEDAQDVLWHVPRARYEGLKTMRTDLPRVRVSHLDVNLIGPTEASGRWSAGQHLAYRLISDRRPELPNGAIPDPSSTNIACD